MEPRLKPVAVGAAAGVALFALPRGVGALVIVAGAVVAGWVLPREPMAAAVLFLLPTVALAAVRVIVDAELDATAGLVVALLMAVLFVGIFTHVGAGLALRRAPR